MVETKKQSKLAVKMAKQQGLEVSADFLMGVPGETMKTIDNTIKFAINLDLDVANFNLFIPFHGTKLYNLIKEDITDNRYNSYNLMINKNSKSHTHQGI